MDAFIKQTITGYTGVFAAFSLSDENLKNDIKSFIADLDSLGESCSDVMDFMTKFSAGGLQQKYADMVARAATPMPSEENTESNIDPVEKKLPSVKDFLEQYRSSYNAVLNGGFRFRAQKAYENIFEVAERTDDLLEMNIILEKERLLWKIVTEDLLDIYEPILAAIDPFNDGVVKQFEKLIQISNQAVCDEELACLSDIAIKENQQYNYRFMSRMTASVLLSGAIMGYALCKIKFRKWLQPQSDLLGLIAQRAAVKRTYEYFCTAFGWDFDDFANDEWMKIWLLVPVNLDTNARIKQVLDPQNIEVMRELLFNEILSERSISDILLHEQQMVYYFLLDKRADEVTLKYQAEAAKLNAHLLYFKYQHQLQSLAENKAVKIPDIVDKNSI